MFALTGDVPEAASLFAHAATLLGGRDPRELVRTATSEVLHHNRDRSDTLHAAGTGRRDGPAETSCPTAWSLPATASAKWRRWGVAGVLSPDRHAGPRRTPRRSDGRRLLRRRGAAVRARPLPPDASTDCVRGTTPPLPSSIRATPSSSGERRAALEALAREAQVMHAARVVDVPVEVASHTPATWPRPRRSSAKS